MSQIKPVGIISVRCEFDQFQVQQILAASNKIASLDDVMSSVEIWRKSHAIAILKIFQETFGDFYVEDDILDCAEDDFEDMEELHEDWDELQDSCFFNSTTSSMLLDGDSECVSGISRIHNASELLAPITENINFENIFGSDIDMEDENI